MAKTYTTVADKGVRDQFTEAMWDTMLRDNLNNLMSPAMCRVTKSGATAIVTATETAVPYDTEALDTDAMHDTVTNNSRITPSTPGLYVVLSAGDFAANGTGYRYAAFKHNGTAGLYGGFDISHVTSLANGWLNPSGMRELNGTTDYVETVVWQTSGGNLGYVATPTASYFGAVWAGRTS